MATRIAALLVLAAIGCNTKMRTPTETVNLYFHTLGRDPGRALSLLADDFHTRHGLAIANLEGWGWDSYEKFAPIKNETIDPNLAPLDAERGLDSAQTAWLLIQADPTFQATAANLEVGIEQERVEARTARVVTSVKLRPSVLFRYGRPFTQIFYLTRSDENAPWQISRIEQQQVAAGDTYAAFAANPTEASRSTLAKQMPPRRAGEGRRDVPKLPNPSASEMP